MKLTTTAVFVFLAMMAFGQREINTVLKKQLDSVMVLDQKYRDTLTFLMDPKKADSIARYLPVPAAQAATYYWALQSRIDSLNVIFIEDVFNKYGYPGKTLVGSPANESAWYIIQHSKKIPQYLPMMKVAAENDELPFYLYAMMLDRDLMYNGKEQVYGSQATCRPLKNGKNIGCFVWPIKDAETVNERRKKAGFKQTVEENATRLGIVYSIIKLDEVN